MVYSCSQLSAQQICEIDTTNFQMITPPNDSLPCVERGVPYYAVMQFFCPPQIAGIDIFSIKVTGFQQLPAGITYSCNPDSCILYPWGRACIVFYGTTNDTAGIYTIKYSGMAYTAQGNASFAYLQNLGILPEYTLTVIEAGNPCREQQPSNIANQLYSGFNVYPNPAKDRLTIELKTTYNNATITLASLHGRTVYRQNLDRAKSSFDIDVSAVSKGMYMLQLHTEKEVLLRKILIE